MRRSATCVQVFFIKTRVPNRSCNAKYAACPQAEPSDRQMEDEMRKRNVLVTYFEELPFSYIILTQSIYSSKSVRPLNSSFVPRLKIYYFKRWGIHSCTRPTAVRGHMLSSTRLHTSAQIRCTSCNPTVLHPHTV